MLPRKSIHTARQWFIRWVSQAVNWMSDILQQVDWSPGLLKALGQQEGEENNLTSFRKGGSDKTSRGTDERELQRLRQELQKEVTLREHLERKCAALEEELARLKGQDKHHELSAEHLQHQWEITFAKLNTLGNTLLPLSFFCSQPIGDELAQSCQKLQDCF